MNLPNKLSILRICFIPFVMFFYLQEFWIGGKILATVLFVLAVLTDMLDGYIARKYNLVTDLGKLLDTNADKILVLSSLLLIIADGTIPALFRSFSVFQGACYTGKNAGRYHSPRG